MYISSQCLNIAIGICTSLIILIIVVAKVYSKYKSNAQSTLSSTSLKNKHVIITGGSSGIGKSLALEAAQRGANVTIIARDERRLNLAKMDINACCVCSTQRINTLSLDVSSNYEEIEKAFIELEQEMGPPLMLINCAGTAVCGKLEDTSVSDIKKMFELNCLGSIYSTKAVIEGMKTRGSGHVVFVASEAAYIGIFGFSAYSASKFALRGFADALNMEVLNYGVKVTVAYPPDTDTPGFAEEEKSKPTETRLISQNSGLWKSNEVAKKIMKDIMDGQYTSVMGIDGFLLSTVCAGMTPSSCLHLILQICLMGPFRAVAAIYLFYFQRIVKKCMIAKNKSKKAE